MSQTHLLDLRRALEQHHWVVAEELDGNDYSISGSWLVKRIDGSTVVHIDFQCLDILETLPIEKAHACEVRENREISAYFARKNRTWPSELASFIHELDKWGS